MTDPNATAYHPFIETGGADEHVVLEDCEIDARTHESDKASELHTHDETHIIFVRTGEMQWKVGDEEFHATPGDTIVTPPDTEHKFEVAGDTPSKTLCLIAPARGVEEQGQSGTHEITKPDDI